MRLKGITPIVTAVLLTAIAVSIVGSTYLWGVPMIEKGQTNSEVVQAENIMNVLAEAITDVSQTEGGTKRVPNTGSLDFKGTFEINQDLNSIIYKIRTKAASISSGEWVPLNSFDAAVTQDNYAVNRSAGTEYILINNGTDIFNCSVTYNAGHSLTLNSPDCTTETRKIGEKLTTSGLEEYYFDYEDEAADFAIISGPEKENPGLAGDKAGVLMAKTSPAGDEFITAFRIMFREIGDSTTLKGRKIKIVESGNTLATEGEHFISLRRLNAKKEGKSSLGGDLTVIPVQITVD